MTKFVIFTTPRTGSTLLVKTLDTHPEVLCAGELFFLKKGIYHVECQYPFIRIPALGNKVNYLINYPKILLTIKSFLNNFFKTADTKIKATGFKLMHFQTYYTPGIFSYLENNGVKTIVLIRKNVLRSTLSDLRARATKVYHNEGGGTVVPKFKVDIAVLEKKMKEIEEFNKQLESASKKLDRKIVYYEDFGNWDQTISGILKYLDIADIPLKAVSKKLNPDKLDEMIENYTEVTGWLNKNGYGEFLD